MLSGCAATGVGPSLSTSSGHPAGLGDQTWGKKTAFESQRPSTPCCVLILFPRVQRHWAPLPCSPGSPVWQCGQEAVQTAGAAPAVRSCTHTPRFGPVAISAICSGTAQHPVHSCMDRAGQRQCSATRGQCSLSWARVGLPGTVGAPGDQDGVEASCFPPPPGSPETK